MMLPYLQNICTKEGVITDMKTQNTIQNIIDKNGIMVIDGSMSTALEHLGADLNSKLWTARALAESPELVRQVHPPAATRQRSLDLWRTDIHAKKPRG